MIDTGTNKSLNKTSVLIYATIEQILKNTTHEINEAKNIGSTKSRSFATIVIFVASVAFQMLTGVFLNTISPEKSSSTVKSSLTLDNKNISKKDEKLITQHIDRILQNSDTILEVKNRVAPSMQIDQNIQSIKSSVEDIKTILN